VGEAIKGAGVGGGMGIRGNRVRLKEEAALVDREES